METSRPRPFKVPPPKLHKKVKGDPIRPLTLELKLSPHELFKSMEDLDYVVFLNEFALFIKHESIYDCSSSIAAAVKRAAERIAEFIEEEDREEASKGE